MFGENYDRTLWLMLVADNIGRDSIVNFIKEIPFEFYQQLHEMINVYNENGKFVSTKFTKTFNASLGKLSIDAHIYDDGELFIFMNKSITDDKITRVSEFSVNLVPMSKEYLSRLPLGTKQYIGEIKDIGRNVVIDNDINDNSCIFEVMYEKSFDLTRSMSGYYINVSSECMAEPSNVLEDFNGILKLKKRICIGKMPDKIYAHQFDDEKRVKRLKRGKKKRR